MKGNQTREGSRARLHAVDVQRERDGTCLVRIELAAPDGRQVHGESRAHDLPVGRIRAGADATIEALRSASSDDVVLQLRGAKAVRAFDSQVVIVAVRAESPRGRRDLIGAVRAPEHDLVRGGSLAVLDALNRFLGGEPGPESPSLDG